MISYIKFVLRLRWFVLSVFLCITLLFGYYVSIATLRSTPREIFFGDNPQYDRYLERCAEYGSDNIVLIGFEGEDLLSAEQIARLRRVVESIEEEEEVDRVESIISAQHIASEGDVLNIDRYADLLENEPRRKEELLETLTTDPLTRGWLMTRDGGHAIVLIEYTAGDDSLEDAPATIEQIYRVFEKEGFNPQRLYRGGLGAVMAEIMEQSKFNLLNILPITALVLIIAVFIMFRRVWPVVITLVITIMAIIWTLGLGVILYGHLNIFSTMIPALILITCFADVIHLISAYLLELASGKPKNAAILMTGREVGTACGYTSVTTFFGFVSMTMVPTPIFKQLGLLMGFGVSVALFTALTLVPIFLSIIRQPKAWRKGSTSVVQGAIDRVLDWSANLTMGRPKTVVVVFIVFFLLACFGFAHIHFETQFTKRFDESNPIRVGLKYFKQHFPGTNPLDIYLEAPEKNGLIDPDLFKKIAEFESWVESLPQVNQVVSLVDLVRKLNQEIDPEKAAAEPFPDSRQALAQLLLLFEMSGGDELERLVDYEYRIMRLNARLNDMGVIETAEVGHAIVKKADELLGDHVTAETLGLEFLLGEWLDDILIGQRQGLILALTTVAILMVISMRSFGIGLISMLPNVLPLLTLLGYTGWFWDRVDTDTMAVLMIAIGIGVDDTIHFLMRLRFEFKRSGDPEKAVRRTFHYSGRAIIITSVILVAGFLPFAWSDYFSVRIMGTLLPASLVVALLADLYWVPAMVKLGWIRFKPNRV